MIAIRVLVRRKAIVNSLELLERLLKPSVNLMSLNVHVGWAGRTHLRALQCSPSLACSTSWASWGTELRWKSTSSSSICCHHLWWWTWCDGFWVDLHKGKCWSMLNESGPSAFISEVALWSTRPWVYYKMSLRVVALVNPAHPPLTPSEIFSMP